MDLSQVGPMLSGSGLAIACAIEIERLIALPAQPGQRAIYTVDALASIPPSEDTPDDMLTTLNGMEPAE